MFRITKALNLQLLSTSLKLNPLMSRCYGIYEPDYLDALKPKYPVYDTINVKITGYDFPILESYQRFVHRIANSLNLDVSECWAHPPKHHQIQKFKPNSAIIDCEYKLTTYERYIQISDMQGPIYPIFLRFIEAGLPEGVTIKCINHTEDLEESRYVPDKDLLDLKVQLDSMGGPTAPTKKK